MYRDFATRSARSLSLVGEVWNESDGTVHLVAEGEESQLLEYIKKLYKGSFLSRVDRVVPIWTEAKGVYQQSSIRY